jgi:hypothetical protein
MLGTKTKLQVENHAILPNIKKVAEIAAIENMPKHKRPTNALNKIKVSARKEVRSKFRQVVRVSQPLSLQEQILA